MPPTEPSSSSPTGKRSRARVLGFANATAAVVLLGGGLIAVAAHGHSGHTATAGAVSPAAQTSSSPSTSVSPGPSASTGNPSTGATSPTGTSSTTPSAPTTTDATSPAGTSASANSHAHSTPAAGSTATGTASGTATASATLPAGSLPLDTLMLPVPAGYSRTASAPLDKDQIASLFSDQASEVSMLTADGYRDGWAAGWNNAGPKDIVSDMLWQFSSAADADTFFTDYDNGNADVAGHLDTAPAPGIADSITFAYKPDQFGYVDHVGVFSIGSVVVRVNTDEYLDSSNALLLSLMDNQLKRLAASPAVTG